MRSTDPDVLLLGSLADPTRLSIVRQLAGGQKVCACDFVECCTLSQPTISHHLKVLREAGVIIGERDGTNIYYTLAPDFGDRFIGVGESILGLDGTRSAMLPSAGVPASTSIS
jgi:ArsR family transcriptional regulator